MSVLYGNRWKIIGELGRGGQSVVFRVVDSTEALSGEYALKRILNPARHVRFQSEVEAIKRLDHPNIVKLIDHSALDSGGDSLEKSYIVMPIADGGDLSKRPGMYRDDLDGVTKVSRQLCGALAAAHNTGIIHRDIKPSNILFNGANYDVVLTDFGICLLRDAERATEVGEVVGPWGFMAPELEGGGQLQVTPSVDIYSLGKVIYYMLSGGIVLPRERLAEGEYAELFSRGERYTILRMLLTKMICPAEQRLRSIDEVVVELDRISTWERDAKLSVLSVDAQRTIDRMKQAGLAVRQAEQSNRIAREQENEQFEVIRKACIEALRAELDEISNRIREPGIITSSTAQLSTPFHGAVHFARGDVLSSVGGYEISIVRETDPFAIRHSLQLVLLRKMKTRSTRRDGLIPAGDVEFVVLPYYRSVNLRGTPQRETQAFLSTRAAQRTQPPLTQTFHGRGVSLYYESSIAKWPAGAKQLGEIISEAVEIVLGVMTADMFIIGL